jgi:hypothetical protein
MMDLIQKAGVPSYVTSIITPLPTNGQLTIPIAKTIPQQVGLIFGMAIDADTVDPANNPLITTANAQALYMVLKDGPTEFFQTIRLSDMLNEFAGSPVIRDKKYMPVNILGNFDLSTSFYNNPGLIVSAPVPALPTVIKLNLWFISTEGYEWMGSKGYVDNTFMSQFTQSKRR